MSDVKKEISNSRKNEVQSDNTNQYQIRPNIGKSFAVANVREIINEVLLQVLDGEYSRFFSFFSFHLMNLLIFFVLLP